MALGGGTFVTQNKILPGAYINFISAERAASSFSDRGVAAIPIELDWGIDGEVFTVEASVFLKASLEIFGYEYTNEKLKGLRDLFLNARTAHFFKINTGGAKATATVAPLTITAKYTGVRGNDLTVVIAENIDVVGTFDVSTYLGTKLIETQSAVVEVGDLVSNAYIDFSGTGALVASAGAVLTGGTNGTVEDATYQTFLDKVESYSFNALGCLSTNDTIKGLFANFTKRMREEIGVKFQTLLFKYTSPDHEGVISVENGLVGAPTDPSAVFWATGAEAGCQINKSVTNKTYDGEFDIDVDYTQSELEAALQAGKFMFHKVGGTVRVLEDINTFVSFTDEKSKDFSSNQTIRVIDQIATDIAVLFNSKYLGKIPNDASGRISLWNDIVKHHQELERIRAIEDFNPDEVTVSQGESKKAVVVEDLVTPVNSMAQLYMAVVVQ